MRPILPVRSHRSASVARSAARPNGSRIAIRRSLSLTRNRTANEASISAYVLRTTRKPTLIRDPFAASPLVPVILVTVGILNLGVTTYILLQVDFTKGLTALWLLFGIPVSIILLGGSYIRERYKK